MINSGQRHMGRLAWGVCIGAFSLSHTKTRADALFPKWFVLSRCGRGLHCRFCERSHQGKQLVTGRAEPRAKDRDLLLELHLKSRLPGLFSYIKVYIYLYFMHYTYLFLFVCFRSMALDFCHLNKDCYSQNILNFFSLYNCLMGK